MHYKRRRTTGSLDLRPRLRIQLICSIDGCEKVAGRRTWCQMHYKRWRKTGVLDPHPRVRLICSIDGCDGVYYARGWCTTHYARWKRSGSTDTRPPKPETCAVEDCSKPVHARGWCNTHYRQGKSRQERLLHPRPPKPACAERFWAQVVQQPGDGCWQWTGRPNGKGGYGHFAIKGDDGKWRKVYAHVWAWTQENGPVPDGLELDHLCRTKLCVRISHLEPVTHAENVRRARLTRCRSGRHEITDETADWDSRGYRRGCKACRRENDARRYRLNGKR